MRPHGVLVLIVGSHEKRIDHENQGVARLRKRTRRRCGEMTLRGRMEWILRGITERGGREREVRRNGERKRIERGRRELKLQLKIECKPAPSRLGLSIQIRHPGPVT